MNARIAALLGLLLFGVPACAQAPATSSPGPKLVVVISVDQFSAALFNEYRSRFTGGLRRLAGGVVFASGYQAHAATETCPGHATILTGDHPARTGIIANHWYDFAAPRQNKEIYCAEDESAPSFTVSSLHLRVPTLGDRMKQAGAASRVVIVSGKDRSAAMMGGRSFDERWWWQDQRFVQNGPSVAAAIAGR